MMQDMPRFDQISNEKELHEVVKPIAHDMIRVIEYYSNELDKGWRTLSRRERDILRHKLEFFDELVHTVESAAAGNVFASNLSI